MSQDSPTPEELALGYIEQLEWPPYSVQEQAIYSWFESEDGILVCAPTGTGKTVIAETALYEALMTGKQAWYTTPLIALTEQKYRELQATVIRWGFTAQHVGLVTGNRKENPDAPILVVVAEVLLNRLLDPDETTGDQISAVVMDEFHSFNDRERGIVWELTLGLLPKHTRLLLISATVGNAAEFVVWLSQMHGRQLKLIQSEERKVPLDFRWVEDQLLPEQLELMAEGDESLRYTPALVFCFNRSECWNVADQLRGRRLLADGQQQQLASELDKTDWSKGAGGKLRQLLLRGVGLHHAGLIPRYRRVVEDLFQKKLLSICVCTETLAAGINLPARSVVMTTLMKGPRGRKTLIDSSSAHQMFGRAGRPQFDTHGYVFATAHEDDVRILRFQKKIDQIPEDTKDPHLIRARKNLKRKMPKRRDGVQYWQESQFLRLRDAPSAKLASRGEIPWRLLAWLIRRSGTVKTVEDAIHRRLLSPTGKEKALKQLRGRLMTLEAAGFLTLDPPPPRHFDQQHGGVPDPLTFNSRLATAGAAELLQAMQHPVQSVRDNWLSAATPASSDSFCSGVDGETPDEFGSGLFGEAAAAGAAAAEDQTGDTAEMQRSGGVKDSAEEMGLLGRLIQEARGLAPENETGGSSKKGKQIASKRTVDSEWQPRLSIGTEQLTLISQFRSVHPLYGTFLLEHLHRASLSERLQLLESILDMPRSVARDVRVPDPEQLAPGPLAVEYLNPTLLSRGMITTQQLTGYFDERERRRVYPLTLAERMRLLFASDFPEVDDIAETSVWCVGDLLQFNGNFDRYVRSRGLIRQEGIIFRHCLKMILLCGELAEIEPPMIDPTEWRTDLSQLALLLTESCRDVDPSSTDEVLSSLRNQAESQGADF
jgi:superfamily II DNA/RNA helicase